MKFSNSLAVCALITMSSLIGLVYFKVTEDREARALEVCGQNLKRLQEILALYGSMNNPEIMPPELDCLVPIFTKALPQCPSCPGQNYQYFRTYFRGFVISCAGRHKNRQLGYPRIFEYTSDSLQPFQAQEGFDDAYKSRHGGATPPGQPLPAKDSPDYQKRGVPFRLKPGYPREGLGPEYQHIFDDPSLR